MTKDKTRSMGKLWWAQSTRARLVFLCTDKGIPVMIQRRKSNLIFSRQYDRFFKILI